MIATNRLTPPPEAVAQVDPAETEQELIERVRDSVRRTSWTIGQAAADWTKRFSAGRTDTDFGRLVGLDQQRVSECRRVWETFGGDHRISGTLWSHCVIALRFEDPQQAMQLVIENGLTCDELRSYLRMERGEDLTVESESSAADELNDADGHPETSDSIDSHEELAPITPPNQDPAETAYAPFRTSGGPPRDETRDAPEKPARGKSDIALAKAFWRTGRELINARGPIPAQTLLAEMLSDYELTDEVEEVDEPRLKSLLQSIDD